VPVYVFQNDQTCTYYYNTTMKSKFVTQTNENGTGKSVQFGLVKPYRTTLLAGDWCFPPEGGSTDKVTGNVFVQVPYVTGTCNSRFTAGTSIAVNPDPEYPQRQNPANQWNCDDQVLLVNTSTKATDSIKPVQDLCPSCSDGHHIDSYTNSPFCNPKDSRNIDYPGSPFYGIRLR
jgi:hypothetical protein